MYSDLRMRPAIPRAAATAVLALAALFAGASCSDSDNGGGMTTTPCLDFAAASTPSAGTVVAQDGTGSTCDVAVIDLIVTDVNGLFGANIVLQYPSTLVSFQSATEIGSVLLSDANPVELIPGVSSGTLTVGLSRLNTSTTVNAVGSQLLVRLSFSRIAATGSGPLSPTAGSALLDAGTPPDSIPGITFSGGIFTITAN